MQGITRSFRLLFTTVAILSIALLSACSNSDSAAAPEDRSADLRLHIGMSREAFSRLFPDAITNSGDRFTRNSREYGINGQWIYSFHGDRLNWYVFNAHETEISEEVFDRTFKATNTIIAAYTGQYGEPWRVDNGYTKYINPKESSHHGYKVREAQWKTPDGQLLVDFSFLGEGGVYSLLLTVQATG